MVGSWIFRDFLGIHISLYCKIIGLVASCESDHWGRMSPTVGVVSCWGWGCLLRPSIASLGKAGGLPSRLGVFHLNSHWGYRPFEFVQHAPPDPCLIFFHFVPHHEVVSSSAVINVCPWGHARSSGSYPSYKVPGCLRKAFLLLFVLCHRVDFDGTVWCEPTSTQSPNMRWSPSLLPSSLPSHLSKSIPSSWWLGIFLN